MTRCLVLFFVACGGATAIAQDSGFPAPASSHGFKSRLNDAAYARALAGLPARRIDPQAVAASTLPTWGVRVNRVTPDSPAAKAGLIPGSLVDGLNGSEYYHHKQGLKPDADGRREVSAVTPDGVRHEFNFEPGVIGTTSGMGYLPEQYLYQSIPRGKWDAAMLVAAVAWQAGDHALAESALQRATAAGMPPSVFTSYFAALLALDRGDLALSKKLLAETLGLLPADRTKVSRYFDPGLTTLALAFQDFELLESVVAERAGMVMEPQAGTIRQWREWAKGVPRESLLNRALADAGENVMPRAILEHGKWHGEFEKMDPGPLRNLPYGAWIPPGHYDHRPFAPPVPLRDAIWEIEVATGDGGPLEPAIRSKGFHELNFSVIDRAGQSAVADRSPFSRRDRVVVGASYYHSSNNERFLRVSGGPSGEEIETQHAVPLLDADEVQATEDRHKDKAGPPMLEPNDPHLYRLTFIRLGDEAEILLDGHPVMHIPVDPKVGDLAFLVHSVGASFVITKMSLRPIGTPGG